MGAGLLGCDAEQNVEIFVIKTDTQLVDTKEPELFYTERMSLGLHMENGCKKRKKLSKLVHLSYYLSFLLLFY